ncbi:hypothetical protein Rhopal_007264-T1 [Rhodotorula paludigena]|uniref:Uncharacterized protein n=1 Tax=Rhodotorula paludigena TaxID=86838 RepID=A0AAV5GNN5_9BASI|nr:hypothetical protein Rhopal_007264-T1 [Rhodotorula paludigena]
MEDGAELTGNTVLVSYETNAAGLTIATEVLETLALAEPTTDPDAADPAADTATDTDTATATATSATAIETEEAAAPDTQPGNVIAPASTCTTAGCPVAPTTYTQNGAIVTWYATGPVTATPQTWSTGAIQSAADYISTVSTATGRPPGNAAPARFSALLPAGGDWGIMAGVAVVGGLVGAVAVL